MPTLSIAGALLAMASPDDDIPWTFSTWQRITGSDIAPYSLAAVTTSTTTFGTTLGWTLEKLKAVRAFAVKFWNTPDSERVEFMRQSNDNDVLGRKTWCEYVSEGWRKVWKINQRIDRILVEHGVHPYMVMRRLKINTVSSYVCYMSGDQYIDAYQLYVHIVTGLGDGTGQCLS